MRSRLSLDDPETQLETTIDFRINTESSLTNRYGTQQRRMRLVVGGATTFKREGNHRTGSAGTKRIHQ
jgi:hypothetical protein